MKNITLVIPAKNEPNALPLVLSEIKNMDLPVKILIIMDNTDRLNLQKMINANDVVDCTNEIRNKKHSQLIKADIQSILDLKSKYPRLKETNPKQYDNMCISRCNFSSQRYLF